MKKSYPRNVLCSSKEAASFLQVSDYVFRKLKKKWNFIKQGHYFLLIEIIGWASVHRPWTVIHFLYLSQDFINLEES